MTLPASVEGRERLRLFCALTLPDEAIEALVRWQRKDLASEARALGRDHLHVTLAFLGHRPAEEVDPIARTLRESAAAASQIVLSPRRYRETRSVGMLVLDDEEGRAAALAGDLHERLERLGVYEREKRPRRPHVTVLRFKRPPGLAPPLPGLGAFSPSGAALYHSVLRSGGAQYEVLESVALGG